MSACPKEIWPEVRSLALRLSYIHQQIQQGMQEMACRRNNGLAPYARQHDFRYKAISIRGRAERRERTTRRLIGTVRPVKLLTADLVCFPGTAADAA